jgi:hypothetical protein
MRCGEKRAKGAELPMQPKVFRGDQSHLSEEQEQPPSSDGGVNVNKERKPASPHELTLDRPRETGSRDAIAAIAMAV